MMDGEMNQMRRKLDGVKKGLEVALTEIKSLKHINQELSGCLGWHVENDEQQEKQINELISIALWSIRRLPTNHLKQYALRDLKKVVGEEHEHSEFIDKCLGEISIDSD